MQKIIALLFTLFFVGALYAAPARQPTMAVLPFQLNSVVGVTQVVEHWPNESFLIS